MRSLLYSRLDGQLAPPPAERRIAFLKGLRYAHRGLHGGDVIENSRAAFSAAVTKEDGIELDVQLSADGIAFVFHDESLDRLTGGSGRLTELGGPEIGSTKLSGSDETIPRLEEILTLVGGRVPILIEIKATEALVGRLCLAVRRAIEGYRGHLAVMSFNPEVGNWFALHAPRITRGLVVIEHGHRGLIANFKRHLALWRAKPDFLAYHILDLPSRFAAQQRARGLPVLTWTVRGAQAETIAAEHADAPIYEQLD